MIIDLVEKVSNYLDSCRPGKLLIISIFLNALQFCVLVLVLLVFEATLLKAATDYATH